MNIQVGAGATNLPGFLNVDVRKVEGVDLVGDAADLSTIRGRSVEILFGHALFEHLFLGHHLAALREWKRVLTADGVMILLAIPDFASIARLYLDSAPGIVGDRFDLHNVYRYTHGEPEHATPPIWPVWKAREGAAPPGWIPQLHKSLFDAGYLRDLLTEVQLDGAIFNYAFPGEDHTLNLGLVAALPSVSARWPDHASVLKALERIPFLERFVTVNTITMSESRKSRDSLIGLASTLASRRPTSLPRRIARRLARVFRPAAAHS